MTLMILKPSMRLTDMTGADVVEFSAIGAREILLMFESTGIIAWDSIKHICVTCTADKYPVVCNPTIIGPFESHPDSTIPCTPETARFSVQIPNDHMAESVKITIVFKHQVQSPELLVTQKT